VLNLYCLIAGNVFPLNPSTMQFPNTVIAICVCVFAYLAGFTLINPRFGYCCALSFASAPWLVTVLRMPEYYNLLSCLLHFGTLYFVIGLLREPRSGFYRVLTPLSLMLYLFTGLDWPSYLLFLAIFVTLTRSWTIVLKNAFNVLPLLGALLLLLWQILLLLKFGADGLSGSLVGYPFVRFFRETSGISGEKVLENTVLAWGPQMALAVAGMLYYFMRGRKRLAANHLALGYLDASSAWLLWAGLAVFASSGSLQYLYVIGMPAAILSGFLLSNLRRGSLVLVIAGLLSYQFVSFTNWHLVPKVDEKRRILAAACFLIEQHPDLRDENKTVVAVGSSKDEGGTAGAVIQ
jgi:hypothetical protein